MSGTITTYRQVSEAGIVWDASHGGVAAFASNDAYVAIALRWALIEGHTDMTALTAVAEQAEAEFWRPWTTAAPSPTAAARP